MNTDCSTLFYQSLQLISFICSVITVIIVLCMFDVNIYYVT